MKLLLDTHVVLWWLDDPAQLAPHARDAIEMPESLVFVSAVVLRCPDDFEEVCRDNGFLPLPIFHCHGLEAGKLIAHHSDPFDRMLIAQARCDGLTLVTRDTSLQAYPVSLLAA